DVGGIAVNLSSSASVRDAYDHILMRVSSEVPNARIVGMLVSPMVQQGVETILGVENDPTFGPTIAFGLGGRFVEFLNDVELKLAPFDSKGAENLIRSSAAYEVLSGARGAPV